MARALKPLAAALPVTAMPKDKPLGYHELANAFPLMDGDEFDALVKDVLLRGVISEGWLFDGQILEGRNRYRAARAAGVPMIFKPYTGGHPIAFVVSANMRRRHMTEGQRAFVAAKLETYRGAGRPAAGKEGDAPVLTRAEAAEITHAKVRTVASAAVVRDKGAPELQDAVARGKLSVRAAAEVAELPEQEQLSLLETHDEKEIIAAAKVIRAEKNAKRKAEKVARTIEIARGNKPLQFDRKFVIISADPPWRYERPLIGDCDKSIENKYPTMSIDEVCAMPVHEVAAEAANVFLHIPQPLAICETPEGLCYPHQIGRAWGDAHWNDPDKRDPRRWFVPRSMIIWEKRSPADIAKGGGPLGMGHYVRTDHECVVIMTRGGLPLPDWKPRSVYHIRSRGELEHSEKPAEIYADIVKMYPAYAEAGLLLALFERQARPGFVVWGNQAPVQKEAA